MLFMSCVCHAFASVHCCLVVTCWETADFLALVCDVYCAFDTFPCVILTLVNVNAPVVATTSWWLHFKAPVVA